MLGSSGAHVRQPTVSIPSGERATMTKFISIIDKSKLASSFVKRADHLERIGFAGDRWSKTCPMCPLERSTSRFEETLSSKESRSCNWNTMVSVQRCSQIKTLKINSGPTKKLMTTVTYYKSGRGTITTTTTTTTATTNTTSTNVIVSISVTIIIIIAATNICVGGGAAGQPPLYEAILTSIASFYGFLSRYVYIWTWVTVSDRFLCFRKLICVYLNVSEGEWPISMRSFFSYVHIGCAPAFSGCSILGVQHRPGCPFATFSLRHPKRLRQAFGMVESCFVSGPKLAVRLTEWSECCLRRMLHPEDVAPGGCCIRRMLHPEPPVHVLIKSFIIVTRKENCISDHTWSVELRKLNHTW